MMEIDSLQEALRGQFLFFGLLCIHLGLCVAGMSPRLLRIEKKLVVAYRLMQAASRETASRTLTFKSVSRKRLGSVLRNILTSEIAFSNNR